MLTRPGPEDVNTGGVGPYTPLSSRWDRRTWLVQKHQEHKSRVEVITKVANGEWYNVWPDLTSTPEAPTVANQIELGINHWTSIGGAMMPSFRVPTYGTEGAGGKRGARKRERRIRELLEYSNASEVSALLWGDYAGSGSAVAGVWADFTKPKEERNPYLVRYDPRHTYPLKDNLGNITELLIARKISKAELRAMLPADWAGVFEKSSDEDVEEWFWFDRDRIFYGIVDVGKDGRATNRNVVLVDEKNELGFVPCWEATRPTFDGQRRGVFDQTVHILRTMQRLMTLTIYSTEEHAFPAVLSYDVVNEDQFGPGTIMQARSAEARLERIAPTSHFDAKDLIARLREEATQASVLPQQLMGDPGASIVSSRGIKASMGALDARLALAHKQFETMFSKLAGFLLAFDEVYCAADKTIKGDYRDNQAAESYNPERDVAGQWQAIATYGLGAGSDPANIEMRINMNVSSGLLSRETGRANLPYLEDPDAEPVKMFRETMQMALQQGILARATQGDVKFAVKALRMLQDDHADISEIMEELIEAMEQQEQAPAGAPGAGGMGPEDVAMGAESLARGGIPGNAEDAPPALPPLAGLMGQDAQYVA